jgi:LmbE family N-acetylglucosaminyl deacetylase
MHLVFFGSHPDDETFANGTIAKYVDNGHTATIVVTTHGSRGHWEIQPEELTRIRSKEMYRAAEILGAEVLFLDYEDASIPGGDVLREAFVDVIRKLKPDILITFHPQVWRDDHRRVGLAASDATLKASLPLHVTEYPEHRPEPEVYFFGRTMTDITPDVFIDVSDYMDVKIESFRQHVSQWHLWGKPASEQGDYLERLIKRYIQRFRNYGMTAGVEYAEAYISRSGRKHAYDLFPVKR